MDREASDEGRSKAGIHESYDMTFDGIRMLQIWNPLFETGPENPDLQEQLELYQQERHNPVPVQEQKSAALMMLGAGSWFALSYFEDEGLKRFSSAITNITNILHNQDLPAFGTGPMNEFDGAGAEVFIAPVAPPIYDELPERRKTPEGIHPGEVEAIDEYLSSIEADMKISLLWSFLALTRDDPDAIVDRFETGFHVIDTVAEVKAHILLNLRCNAKLNRLQGSSHDRTCCTEYHSESFVQSGLIALGLFYVLACIVCEILELWMGHAPRWPLLSMDVGIFVTALLCCYYADRTHLFAKGTKQLIGWEFGTLVGLATSVGLMSIRKAQKPSKPEAPPSEESQPLLSRDQTDEWKGWMQAIILIYHWCGASKSLGIYIMVRLLVASYLFQTGYGHTLYFLTKKDFSFKRVASIMLRLNLLSCALPYFMNTDYMLYYFAPLVSFWFMIVYITLAVGSKYNTSLRILLWKIAFSSVVVSVILLATPLPRWTFSVLKAVFQINWDLHEWEFRACLDALVVYVGMLSAIVYLQLKQYSPSFVDRCSVAVVGLVAIPGYWYVCRTTFNSKQSYNQWHPYISYVPILAFIAMRNVSNRVRSYYSKAFAWLGQCSLETFTLQFHLFLAADTKGILLLDIFEGAGSRWIDLALIVPVFLWLSWRVAGATSYITKLFTDEGLRADDADDAGDAEMAIWTEPLRASPSSFSDSCGLWTAQLFQHSKSLVNDLRVKVAALLGLMWLLNLVS